MACAQALQRQGRESGCNNSVHARCTKGETSDLSMAWNDNLSRVLVEDTARHDATVVHTSIYDAGFAQGKRVNVVGKLEFKQHLKRSAGPDED